MFNCFQHQPRTVTVFVHAKDLAAACSRRQEDKPRVFGDDDIADIPSMYMVYLPTWMVVLNGKIWYLDVGKYNIHGW